MRIYFDMCCLQRPMDDPSQFRIEMEGKAVTSLLSEWKRGLFELVASETLFIEAEQNPDPQRQDIVTAILEAADIYVSVDGAVDAAAGSFDAQGLKGLDSYHLACAIRAGVDYLCTCDDRFLRRARSLIPAPAKAVSPLELMTELNL